MFSKELEQSIANLFDQAQDQNLEYLTIEHLLLMLLSDFEVRQALKTNDVNHSKQPHDRLLPWLDN